MEPSHGKERLLDKYNIPIHYLDFPYIEQCNKGSELERIVKILRSGQEGLYPELTTAAEKRLSIVKPNSKLLIQTTKVLSKSEVEEQEWLHLSKDLNEWVEDVSRNDKELIEKRIKSTIVTTCKVRHSENEHNRENKTPVEINKKISSTDYASWDKYDVDTEMLKMDLKDEKLKKNALKKEVPKKRVVDDDEIDFATEAEAIHEAKLEKEKGNEFYKSGEYCEALEHYNISLKCKPLAATYTNRALVNMKMTRYRDAIKDCEKALEIEPRNFKACLRATESYKKVNDPEKALEYVQMAIQLDPNSTEAQDLANTLRKFSNKATHKRIFIEEVEHRKCNEKSELIKKKNIDYPHTTKVQSKRNPIISIPGSSTMSPPFYVGNEKEIDRIMVERSKNRSVLESLFSLKLDEEEEEEEDCTVIHIGKEAIEDSKSEVNCNQKEQNIVNLPKKPEVPKIDDAAGGDCKPIPNTILENLNFPYNFIQAWTSIGKDPSYKRYAEIVRKLDFEKLDLVIGCKMDYKMFNTFVNCLHKHFMVPTEIDRLHSALINMRKVPRFKMIASFLSPDERKCLVQIFEFLDQHNRPIPLEIKNDYV